MSGKCSNSQGITFMEVVLLLLVVLKLTGVIDWSWWWVLSPVWGILFFIGVLLGLLFLKKRRHTAKYQNRNMTVSILSSPKKGDNNEKG